MFNNKFVKTLSCGLSVKVRDEKGNRQIDGQRYRKTWDFGSGKLKAPPYILQRYRK